MANINTGYQIADRYGRAAFEQMDTYLPTNLLAGSFPEFVSDGYPMVLANSTIAMAQFTVVALDANGFLVPATATGNKAVGILAHAVAAASVDNQTVAKARGVVWLSGCFNLSYDSPLIWDASFTTDDLKSAAFKGAPTPTQIMVRHRYNPTAT